MAPDAYRLHVCMPSVMTHISDQYVLNIESRQQAGMGENCNLCGNVIADSERSKINSARHATCVEEYSRRLVGELCPRCGAAANVSKGFFCDSCNSDSPCIGYPPGGA